MDRPLVELHQDPEKLRELQHRFYDDVWNERRTGAIDLYLAPDCIAHGFASSEAPPTGNAYFREFHQQCLIAFPDVWFDIEQILVDGDTTATRYVASGTMHGPLMGMPPTGRRFEVRGLGMARYRNYLAVECWNSFDRLDMLRQLGLMP